MKKIISMLLIFILVFSFANVVLADDIEEEYDEEEIAQEILNASANVEDIPKTNARAVLILDRDSNKVLYEKNGYTKRAMASTTKIMTCLVVLENADLTQTVEISKKAGGTGGSRLGLKAKDKVTIHDLLYGLMLKSRKRCSRCTGRNSRRQCDRFWRVNE